MPRNTASTIADSSAFSRTMTATVPVMTTKLWISTVKLLLNASEIVSMSLVKRLISSPCVRASKKRSGSFCTFENSSSRISRTIFCATRTINCE